MGFGFLLTISFLLHIITLVAIYFLFKQLTDRQQKSHESMKDVIALMDTYLEDIKSENEKLQEQLHQNTSTHMNTLDKAAPVNPKEQASILDNVPQVDVHTSDMEDQAEMSVEARILQLHRQGKNVEAIARELDCGKTEAELVIKFHAE